MKQENIKQVKDSVANQQDRKESFYVPTRAYGHAAVTTDIIRVQPRNNRAA